MATKSRSIDTAGLIGEFAPPTPGVEMDEDRGWAFSRKATDPSEEDDALAPMLAATDVDTPAVATPERQAEMPTTGTPTTPLAEDAHWVLWPSRPSQRTGDYPSLALRPSPPRLTA